MLFFLTLVAFLVAFLDGGLSGGGRSHCGGLTVAFLF